MSGFDASWLALRAPADARARNRGLESVLHAELAGRPGRAAVPSAWRAVDLACGTGANPVHLAPRLPGPQQWSLLDSDPALLTIARQRTATLHDAGGGQVAVELARLDLADAALAATCRHATLVTASALLDLVGAEWMDGLAAACADAGALALFALDYDGRRECWPPDPDDLAAHAAFDRHQRRDKGFGPALGPAAGAYAARACAARGYRVLRARSDWLLDEHERALQRALLAGWTTAATEAEPSQRERFRGWHARRLAHVDAGRSTLLVGHEDLLAIPPVVAR